MKIKHHPHQAKRPDHQHRADRTIGLGFRLPLRHPIGEQPIHGQLIGRRSRRPSTIFYNPAGLTKLEGTKATINLNIVAPNVKYSNGQAQYPEVTQWNDTTKQLDTVYPRKDPVQGSSSGKITDDVIFAPHLYASHQINDKFTIGLGTYVPFGSGTEYDHDSVLRYNLNELGLQTLAIQPTVAYKLNDRHSFAVGFIAQHTTAELRQYANFGPAVAGSLRNTGSQIATGLTQVASGIQQVQSGIAATEAAGG